MELHPGLVAIFAVVGGLLAAVAVVWFYAAYGAWIDDAFDNERWIWFIALLAFTFPASLISWLVVRLLKRSRGAPAPTQSG